MEAARRRWTRLREAKTLAMQRMKMLAAMNKTSMDSVGSSNSSLHRTGSFTSSDDNNRPASAASSASSSVEGMLFSRGARKRTKQELRELVSTVLFSTSIVVVVFAQ